jgi:hypothetical protein
MDAGAAISVELAIDSGKISGTTGTNPPPAATGKAQSLGDSVATAPTPVPATAALALFDSAYQQLLHGGANQ